MEVERTIKWIDRRRNRVKKGRGEEEKRKKNYIK